MRITLRHWIVATGITGLAALGGALMVFSAFDDAPGGVLLGLLLVLASVALGARTQRHE